MKLECHTGSAVFTVVSISLKRANRRSEGTIQVQNWLENAKTGTTRQMPILFVQKSDNNAMSCITKDNKSSWDLKTPMCFKIWFKSNSNIERQWAKSWFCSDMDSGFEQLTSMRSCCHRVTCRETFGPWIWTARAFQRQFCSDIGFPAS